MIGLRLRKVVDGVWGNWDGETGGNVGVVDVGEGVVAVDAQYPGSARQFREAIGRVSKKPVSHLLLTHVHGDHVFGSMAFKDVERVGHKRLFEKMQASLGAEWAPGNLEVMLETYKRDTPERWWLFEGLEIVLPTITFTDRWELGGLEFVHTGGHTDCSSVVVDRDRGVVFAGDLLFVGRFPWAGDPSVSPDAWIEGLDFIKGIGSDLIVPGHGPLCDRGEVGRQLKWFREMRWIMRGLISEGASEEEAVDYEYPVLYESDRTEWVKRSYRQWYKHWKGSM